MEIHMTSVKGPSITVREPVAGPLIPPGASGANACDIY